MRNQPGIAAAALVLCACATVPRGAPAPADAASRIYTRSEVARAVDSLAEQPAFRTAVWGMLAVNVRTGDTVFAHNPATILVPASNTKIVSGGTALLKLGPEYQWKTIVAARGAIRDGVLAGDLVVFGRGDPTVSTRVSGDAMNPLRQMADSIATRGITRVAGRVVQGGNAFPDARWGAGWQWDYLDAAYAAGVDELFFNEGTVRVTVRGASEAGAPAVVSSAPARSYPVVRNEVVTQPAIPGARPRVSWMVDSISGQVTASGTIPADSQATQTLTLRDPAAAYLYALREALAERGIAVDSAVDPSARAVTAQDLDTLFTFHSRPLAEILPEMMKPSQNQLAEIFLKTVGLEVTGVGSADSGLRVIRDQMEEWGVSRDGYALRDGSGLTRNNFISAESVVRILRSMRDHELFPIFFDALPIAGVDGTLRSRMQNTPADSNVRGKTGTLARASALSGYVRTRDGEEIVFSLICNNFTAPASAVTGMQNQIAIMLASLDWRR